MAVQQITLSQSILPHSRQSGTVLVYVFITFFLFHIAIFSATCKLKYDSVKSTLNKSAGKFTNKTKVFNLRVSLVHIVGINPTIFAKDIVGTNYTMSGRQKQVITITKKHRVKQVILM